MMRMSAQMRLDDIWNDWRDERRRGDRDVGAGGTFGSAWLAAEVRARLLAFLSSESDIEPDVTPATGDARDRRASRR